MGEEILISFTSSYHSTLNIPHSEPHKKNAIYAKTNKVSSSDMHSSHHVYFLSALACMCVKQNFTFQKWMSSWNLLPRYITYIMLISQRVPLSEIIFQIKKKCLHHMKRQRQSWQKSSLVKIVIIPSTQWNSSCAEWS